MCTFTIHIQYERVCPQNIVYVFYIYIYTFTWIYTAVKKSIHQFDIRRLYLTLNIDFMLNKT